MILKMAADKKNKDKTNVEKGRSHHLKLKTEFLPFVVDKHTFKEIDRENKVLEQFIKLIEKKFDTIWYLGTDYLGDELYERFLFHHGGFMEISLRGEINAFFFEDKTQKLKDAIFHACSVLSSRASAMHAIKHVKIGQKLISLKDSLKEEAKEVPVK